MNRFSSIRYTLAATVCTIAAAHAQLRVGDGQTVAFLGDSITAGGWGSHGGYVKLIVDGLGKQGVKITPVPAGVGGHKSNDMLARLDRDVLSKKPDWMTLSCGVNDVWHGEKGVDLESYKKNITEIVDKAAAQGVKVVLLTATPIGEEANDNNAKLVPYNEFLRGLAKERGLPLADANAAFQEYLKDKSPTKESRFLTTDGVHMNPEGNVLMAKTCLEAFGTPSAKVKEIEKQWLDQPATAEFVTGNYDPRPRELGITLQQFRALEKLAQSRNVDVIQLNLTLWMKTFSEVVAAHASEPLLNAEALKKETNQRIAEKLDTLLKNQR